MKKLLVLLIAVLTAALLLTACGDNPKYSIKFMVDGEEYKTLIYTGEQFKMPAEPAKEDYIFDGWYYDNGTWGQPCTAQKLLQKPPESDITVYAKWKIKKYTVTFETNGGDEIEPLEYQYNAEIDAVPQTELTGWTFVGWYDNSEFNGDVIQFPYVIKSDITLYAKWEIKKYTVTFETNGGGEIEPLEYQYNAEIDAEPQTELTGWTFVGWYDNGEFNGEAIQFPYVIENNITLYAKWSYSDFEQLCNARKQYFIDAWEGFELFTEEEIDLGEFTYRITDYGKELLIGGGSFAIECNNSEIVEFLLLFSEGNLTRVKDTNIIAMNYFSFDKILGEEIIFTDDFIFNYNGKSIIRYIGEDTVVTIPDGVLEIGSLAFYYSSVTKVTIPDSVEDCGILAFGYCYNLEEINLPQNITTINVGLFLDCTSLKNIELPEGLTVIESDAFSRCTALKSIILPVGVTEIGNFAFRSCVSLESVVLSDNLTVIGESAFSDCINLTDITLPENLTTIQSFAFRDCQNLQSIVIPLKVEIIGEFAFYDCDNLTIYCRAESKPAGWHNNWYQDITVEWGYNGD